MRADWSGSKCFWDPENAFGRNPFLGISSLRFSIRVEQDDHTMASITVKINGSVSLQTAVTMTPGNVTKYGDKVVFSDLEPRQYSFYAEETIPGGTLTASDSITVNDPKDDLELSLTLK
jgi:hypothetical protein